jgi:glutamate synthase domain-containing protein 2
MDLLVLFIILMLITLTHIKFIAMKQNIPRTQPRKSATFDDYTLSEIRRAAVSGIYDIRGGGSKRVLPGLDDLLFLGASMSRYPLEGYREACGTDVVLGTRFAKNPIRLKIPITIAGMSFGSLSAQAKEALGRGATIAGTSTTTGDGGMTPEERGQSETLIYQYLPSRYGMNPDDLRKADAIEVVVGQGAKPGGGGMLLGQKISDRVAEMRNLPKGIDQRSACRHPDWTGPDDLEIKINELREITDWEKPIYIKIGGARPYYDTALSVKAGADVIVIDGMQGGTAATQEVFIEHVGQPTLACIRPAVKALQDMGMHRKVQLIVSGGIRNGADVAKALALGADAVSIGTAAMVALGDNDPALEEEYQKLGTTAGAYDDWHEGQDPAGISTQDPELSKRLDPVLAGRRLANYLKVITLEAQTIARACGKSHVLNLEPEDLVALTVESAAMAQVPLSGTDWIPGKK